MMACSHVVRAQEVSCLTFPESAHVKTPTPWRLSSTQSPVYCFRSLPSSHTQYVPLPVRRFAAHSPSYLFPFTQVCVPNPSLMFLFQSPTYLRGTTRTQLCKSDPAKHACALQLPEKRREEKRREERRHVLFAPGKRKRGYFLQADLPLFLVISVVWSHTKDGLARPGAFLIMFTTISHGVRIDAFATAATRGLQTFRGMITYGNFLFHGARDHGPGRRGREGWQSRHGRCDSTKQYYQPGTENRFFTDNSIHIQYCTDASLFV